RAMSWVTWLPKSTIRILSCAEATWGDDDSRACCAAVMDSRYATRNEAATLWGPSWPGFHVFRANAKHRTRNDGLCLPAQDRNEKAVGSGPQRCHQPAFG